MNTHTPRPLFGALVALAAVALLGGCDRNDDGRTAGQQLDRATAQVDVQADRLAAEARSTGKELSRELGTATNEAMGKLKDASITSAINAKLLADSRLSALRIDVDTADGRVRLSGSAPDGESKDHAAALASRIDGVVSVDNQLVLVVNADATKP